MKKTVLLLAIIAITVIISGCLETAEDKQIRQCTQLQSLKVTCVGQFAIDKNNVEPCNKAFSPIGISASGTDTIARQDCIIYFVEQTGNIEACNTLSIKDIEGKETNQQQILNCRIKSLKKNPDTKICEAIPETTQQNDCFYSMAVETGQSKYCDNIDANCNKDKRCNWLKQSCVYTAKQKA